MWRLDGGLQGPASLVAPQRCPVNIGICPTLLYHSKALSTTSTLLIEELVKAAFAWYLGVGRIVGV